MEDERQISREIIAGALILLVMVVLVVLSTSGKDKNETATFGSESTSPPSTRSGDDPAVTTTTQDESTTTALRDSPDENNQWIGYKYVADPVYAAANDLDTIPDGFTVAGGTSPNDGTDDAAIGEVARLQSADVSLLWMAKYAGLLDDGRTPLLEVTDVITLPDPKTKTCLGCARSDGSADPSVVAVLGASGKATRAWRVNTNYEFVAIDADTWRSLPAA
jgi:hypothetical protein